MTDSGVAARAASVRTSAQMDATKMRKKARNCFPRPHGRRSREGGNLRHELYRPGGEAICRGILQVPVIFRGRDDATQALGFDALGLAVERERLLTEVD